MIRNSFPHLVYTVAELWPDGVLFCETDGSRTSAHDAAADAVKRGHEYTVTRVEYSLSGRPVAVCDVTHSFVFEPQEDEADVYGNRVDEAYANAGGFRGAAE